MSIYSMPLSDYVDHFSQYDDPFASVRKKIERARPYVFDFDYPFFDQTLKQEFETLFLRKFYMTDIGFETYELWHFHLETWLLEKMPYYNQRFESELIKFDPLMNVKTIRNKEFKNNGTTNLDSTDDSHFETIGKSDGRGKSATDSEMTGDGTSSTTGSKTVEDIGSKKGNNLVNDKGGGFNRKINSDTPDKRLDITTEDGSGIIRYASKIEENKNTNFNDQEQHIDESTKKNGLENTNDSGTTHDEAKSSSVTNSEDHVDTKQNGTSGSTGNKKGSSNESGDSKEVLDGKIGVETYSEMLNKYRQTFINVKEEILDEARKDLFMLVY